MFDCLGKTVAFTADELTGPFTIVGDFNCNPNNTASPCGKILNDFQNFPTVVPNGISIHSIVCSSDNNGHSHLRFLTLTAKIHYS